MLQRTDGAGARALVADDLGSAVALLDPLGARQRQHAARWRGPTRVDAHRQSTSTPGSTNIRIFCLRIRAITPAASLLLRPGVAEMLMRTDGARARALVADGMGSALPLLDPVGALQRRYAYGPFGSTASTNTYTNARMTGLASITTGLDISTRR